MSDALVAAMIACEANKSSEAYRQILERVQEVALRGSYQLDFKCKDLPGATIVRAVQLLRNGGFRAEYIAATDTIHISWNLHEVTP